MSQVVIIQYRKAQAALFASAKQNKYFVPADLSTDNDAYIPISRNIWKLSLTNNDFNGTGKNPTISILNAKGYKINMLYAKYKLPAQYARTLTDMLEYDSLPGIHAIQQMETSVAGAFQLETVTSPAIVLRLLDAYGIDNFKRLASKWWGGYKDVDHCDFNQQFTGLTSSTLSNDINKNIIKPEVKITLPIPTCLLFNKEKYNFFLNQESPIEFKFIFKQISNIVSRTKDVVLTELADSIDIYMEYLNPCEYGNFWTGLAYTQQLEDYYFMDNFFETFVKSFTVNQELKIQIKPSICYQLRAFVVPKEWASGYEYFGTSVMSSAENMIGGMVSPTFEPMNSNYVINIGKGVFVGSNTATSASLEILGWAATATNFNLRWKRSAVSNSVVTIKCTVPLGSFGDLYLDLSTFNPSMANIGVTNISQLGSLFYTDEFTLNIQPYNPALTTIDNIEVPTIKHGTGTKLARGFFTFNPDPDNVVVNRHAFWSVDNIVPSKLLQPKQFAFDFFFSQKLPTQHTANILAYKNFVLVNKNMHQFYDLDGRWPLEVKEMYYEKAGSNNEQLFNHELELWRDNITPEHRWRAQIELNFNYKDMYDRNKNTFGYLDFRAADIIQYQLKLNTVNITYDGNDLTDTLKEYNQSNRELEIISLQSSIRTLKHGKDAQLHVLGDDEREMVNSEIIKTVLAPSKLYIIDKNYDPVLMSRGPRQQPIAKRRYDITSVQQDNYSWSNKRLAVAPDQREYY